MKQYLEGPNALISSTDSISAAKVATKFAKKHENLVIKAPAGGYVEEYAKKYNIKFEAI